MSSSGHTPSGWRVAGRSVRGNSHERTGMPNQDGLHWLPREEVGGTVLLALSDGHGSAKSFRSEIGSRLAVDVVTRGMHQFLESQVGGGLALPDIERAANDMLPRSLVRDWQDKVGEHLARNPFTAEERERLQAKDGDAGLTAVRKNPSLAYGATALSLAVTEHFILYIQIGDGDILVVGSDDQVTRPLPKDNRLFANQTTSLCTTDAWKDFRVCLQRLSAPSPALILLATDGYANSFQDESGFLQVGSDLSCMIRDRGWEAVTGDLEGWLREASRDGSGDDITVGLVAPYPPQSGRVSSDGSLLETSSLDFMPWTPVHQSRQDPPSEWADARRHV